jgi:t-SNARE complex subunit (syntaxin)
MDILDHKIDILFDQLTGNFKDLKSKQLVVENIKQIQGRLKDYQTYSNRLIDLNTIISNNETSLDIMNKEVSNKTNSITDINNNFLVENYELNALNKNEKNIEILNAVYSKRIKYLIIMFLILVFIYYVVVNINPN